jgi:two-component system LytT family response regulator
MTSIAPSRLRVTRVENDVFAAPGAAAPAFSHRRSRSGPIVILRVRGRIIVVDEASIDWIDGAGNYVKFHAGAEKHRVRGTLTSLEGVLSPQFVRSCRSTIINITAVHEFVRTSCADLVAVLRTGDRLTVGRRFRGNLEAALSIKL